MNQKYFIFTIFIIWIAIGYNCDKKEYKLIEKKIYPNKVIIKNNNLIKEVWKVDYIFKAAQETIIILKDSNLILLSRNEHKFISKPFTYEGTLNYNNSFNIYVFLEQKTRLNINLT